MYKLISVRVTEDEYMKLVQYAQFLNDYNQMKAFKPSGRLLKICALAYIEENWEKQKSPVITDVE